MKTAIRMALVAAMLAAFPLAAAAGGACASDPAATGLQARVDNIQEKMERIRGATDPAQQHRLLVLHDKLMREALHEMRRRNASLACRVELTEAMMDQLLLHEQVANDRDGD